MVAACLCGAMAQNDAMFVYRNDGQINAFLKADVDRMRYSHIGLDSLYHGEYVVQEVWTPDSIYRIPLAAIDSVCFVTLCPDGNHPHAIDLGLPSGTKWCCRNVGAYSPEDFGGYYAWGETSEKSEYSEYTYEFFDEETNNYFDEETNNYINIGAEISGTQYDVAHVVMGGSWRMPTLEQIKELIYYCTWKWTQLNGVNGQLVTGPNGGQIFLPAAGYRWDVYLAGSRGYYWSGSLYPGYDFYAYVLYFNSGTWDWGRDDRFVGQSVRAVCP